MAAAVAAVPSRLCPQPCPGPFSTTALFAAVPAFCERPGSASYSARKATVGEPDPAVATNAVGSPPTPQVTLKPSFWSASTSACADFFSCSAVSGVSQIFRATVVHRSRVWSRYASVGRSSATASERHDQRHHEGESATVHGHTSGGKPAG